MTTAAIFTSHLAVSPYLYIFATTALAVLLLYSFFEFLHLPLCFAFEATPETFLQHMIPAATPPVSRLGLSPLFFDFVVSVV